MCVRIQVKQTTAFIDVKIIAGTATIDLGLLDDKECDVVITALLDGALKLRELRRLMQPSPKLEKFDLDVRRYVLVYIGYEGEYKYLGIGKLTDNIENAVMMTRDEVERKWNSMSVKFDWQVWSVRPGIVLDACVK